MRNRNLLIGGLIALVLGLSGMAWGGGNADWGWGGWDHGSMMGGSGMMWGWDDYESSPPTPGAATVGVTAYDMGFEPARVEVPSGEAFNLRVANDGRLFHDLTIASLDARVGVFAGESATMGLGPLEPGEYSFECSVPGHAESGMVGVLVITG